MLARQAALGSPRLVDEAVDVVLDGVVAAAGQLLSDAGPGRAVAVVEVHDLGGLVFGDGVVPQRRVEVLVVALAALLGVARAHEGGDGDPVLGARLVDERHEAEALVGGPGASSLGVFARHGHLGDVFGGHGEQILDGDEVHLPLDDGASGI